MTLTQYEFARADYASSPAPKQSGDAISLPLPKALNSTYSPQWQNDDFGITGNAMRKNVQNVKGMVERGGTIQSVVEEISQYATASGVWNKFAGAVKTVAMDAGSGAASTLLGYAAYARNPFQALIFQGMDFRTFTFDYNLVARSAKEADAIKKIILTLKKGLVPDFTETFENNLFKYPKMFQPSFPNVEDETFKIRHVYPYQSRS